MDKKNALRQVRTHCVLFLLGGIACILIMLFTLQGGRSEQSLRKRQSSDGVFWLVVEITFKDDKSLRAFETEFRPLAHFVKMHEPHTLSYQMAKSDSDPNRILIFERYMTKEDYLNVHKSSEAFHTFRSNLEALDATIVGHSFYESGIGYV